MKQKILLFFLSLILFFSLFSTLAYANVANHASIAFASNTPDNIKINDESYTKKKVLILNSYHKGLEWTDDMEQGIKESLKSKTNDIDFYYEYMDIKRHSSSDYLDNVRTFLFKKYTNHTFDAIIATDDQAFQFVSDYSDALFKDIPIIFCGVNYFDDALLKKNDKITGVVESNNFKKTIDLALQLQPNLERMIVINDTTLTGQNNRKIIDALIPHYENQIIFEFWSDVNMADIQTDVQTLSKNDVILLLGFNQDKSHHYFSFQDSIQLISKNSPVPIYGSWDFYLDDGLLGGMLTRGIVQGKVAGNLLAQVLDGTAPKNLPIIKNNLGVYMFDYTLLKKYDIKLSALPKDSIVINRPFSIKELYQKHQAIFVTISLLIVTIIALFFIVYSLLNNIKIKQITAEKEHKYAMTDMLTGIPNRRACFKHLNRCICGLINSNKKLTIAFLDVNDLKYVNDSFGHLMGDELLKTVCQLVQKVIKETGSIYRMAGDEFIVVFNELSLAAALKLWNNVTANIETFNASNTKPFQISVSVGFVQYNPEKHPTIDHLIEEADQKMYKNKMVQRASTRSQTTRHSL